MTIILTGEAAARRHTRMTKAVRRVMKAWDALHAAKSAMRAAAAAMSDEERRVWEEAHQRRGCLSDDFGGIDAFMGDLGA